MRVRWPAQDTFLRQFQAGRLVFWSCEEEEESEERTRVYDVDCVRDGTLWAMARPFRSTRGCFPGCIELGPTDMGRASFYQ